MKIHAIPGAYHHERRGNDGDQRQELDHFPGLVGGHVQVHLQDAREGVGVGLGQLRNMEQGVVHVAVIGHHVGADEFELTASEPRQDLALRPHNLAQVQHFFLSLEELVQGAFAGILQGQLFQLRNLQ